MSQLFKHILNICVYGVQLHFQHYFSYIASVSFIGEETVVPGESKLLTNFIR